MAILKNTMTGSGLSGSTGDIYYRIVDGVQQVCSKPSHYTLPMDDKSVTNRTKMHHLGKIIPPITSNPFFKSLWNVEEIKGRGAYNKFLSFNYPKNAPFAFTSIKLSPVSHFTVEIENFSIVKTKAFITLKAITPESGIDIVREPYLMLQGFIYKEDKDKYEVIYIPQDIKQINYNEPLAFEMELKLLVKKEYKVLMLASTLSSLQQPARHSETIYYSC